MEPSLSGADCRDTVTSVRRPAVPILIALLMLAGALLPATALAHSALSAGALISASVESSSVNAPARVAVLDVPARVALLRASARVAVVGAQPAGPSLPWILVALATVIMTLVRPGWRRAVGVTLVVLLAVLAVEQSVHSVHHLAAPTPTACVVAAAAGHLAAIADGGVPTLPALVLAPRALAELAPSRALGIDIGRDPARAPPFVIA